MNAFWVAALLITEIILFSFSLYYFKKDIVSPSVATLGFFIISTACCLLGINEWKNVTFTLCSLLIHENGTQSIYFSLLIVL